MSDYRKPTDREIALFAVGIIHGLAGFVDSDHRDRIEAKARELLALLGMGELPTEEPR